MDRNGPDRLTLAAFAGGVVIGGANFVAVAFSNAELEPMYGAALRFTAAAVLFGLLAALLRAPWPRRRALAGSMLYGALGFGAAYGLVYFAMLEIGPGTAAVILATVPLFGLGFAVLTGQERLTADGVVGGLLAVAGVAVLSRPALTGGLSVVHLAAALASAAAAAGAIVVVKGFPRGNAVTTNAVGMATGSVPLWLASVFIGEAHGVPVRSETWAALGWLVAGSVVMFWLLLFVVERWTASATTYAMTLMPVVAFALGAVLAREPVRVEMLAGAGLVMLAVYVGAVRPVRAARAGAGPQS